MIIKSLSGSILLQTSHKSIKSAVEYATSQHIDLSHADLRGARLCGASLDGLKAAGACLWGADLSGADIGLADMRGADLRRADLADACFAETDLSGVDARGAYFSRTIFEGAILDELKFSCPSFWGCDLGTAASFKNLQYSHLGEVDVVMNSAPIIISGLDKRLILMDGACLWGNELLRERSRNATPPIPKIKAQS